MKTISTIMALPFSMALLYALPASAHGWYPKECCSSYDCVQADQMMIDNRGDRIVMVGSRRIWVSRYLSPRLAGVHLHRVVAEQYELR